MVQCLVCGRRFDTEGGVATHLRRSHPTPERIAETAAQVRHPAGLQVKPIRWGVTLNSAVLGEVWDVGGGRLGACAFVGAYTGNEIHPVPLDHLRFPTPELAAQAVRDWLASVRVFDPQLSRPYVPGEKLG